MGTRENKFQSLETSCANTGKISSSVSFQQYFQVFHTKFNIRFRRLVLLEIIVLRRYLKQSYKVSNTMQIILVLDFCPLVTRTSVGFLCSFLALNLISRGKSDPLSKVGYSFSRYLQLTVLFAFCPTEGWDWIVNIHSSKLNVSPLLDLKSYHHLLADS